MNSSVESTFEKSINLALNSSSHLVCINPIASHMESVCYYKNYFYKMKSDPVIPPIKDVLLSKGRNIIHLT